MPLGADAPARVAELLGASDGRGRRAANSTARCWRPSPSPQAMSSAATGELATPRRRRLWQVNCRRRGRRGGLHWAGWRHDQGILGVGEGRGRLRRAGYWRRLGSWQGRGRGKRLSPVGGGWGACDCKEGERGAGETVIGADGRICRCEEGVYWEPVVGGDCRACDREEAERSAGEQASGGWGASAANEGEGGSGLAFLPGGHYEIGVNHPGG